MRPGQLLPPADSRALIVADLLSTVGSGLWFTGGVLFFVQAAGLSIVQTSVLLTCAGALALLATVPIGHLADRVGPRGVSMMLLGTKAIATGSLVVSGQLPALWTATMLMMISDRGLLATFGSLTAAVGGPDRVRVQGYLRSGTNVGLSVGSLAAAPFLAVGDVGSYHAMLCTTAGVLTVAAVALLGVRRVPPAPAEHRSSIWTAIRDRRYLTVALLHGLLSVQYDMLSYALPLWVVYGTDAPHWLISVLLTTNTVLVAVCQVPVSARVRTVRGAAALGRRSGVVFLVSAGILAGAHYSGGGLTIALLLVAVVVHTMGELWQAASAFLLSFELAHEHAAGQYQGVFALGRGLERVIAPTLLGVVCVRWGPPGWLLLGAALAIVGRGLPRAVAPMTVVSDREVDDHDPVRRGARQP